MRRLVVRGLLRRSPACGTAGRASACRCAARSGGGGVQRAARSCPASRQMTSSRQSPSRSAVSVGVDLVLLFDVQPSQLSSVPAAVLGDRGAVLAARAARRRPTRSGSWSSRAGSRRSRRSWLRQVAVRGVDPHLGAGAARERRRPRRRGRCRRRSIGRLLEDRAGRARRARPRSRLLLVLVGHEHLEPRAAPGRIAHVQRVAVAEAGRAQPTAVVVDRRGAVDDLLRRRRRRRRRPPSCARLGPCSGPSVRRCCCRPSRAGELPSRKLHAVSVARV